MDYWKIFKETLFGWSIFRTGQNLEKSKNERKTNKLRAFADKWMHNNSKR